MAEHELPEEETGTAAAVRDSRGRFVKGSSGNPAGRPPLTPEIRRYGRESAGRLREIADGPDTPVKLKAEIERFFFEALYGKASAADREEKGAAGVLTVKFEGALEEWSR